MLTIRIQIPLMEFGNQSEDPMPHPSTCYGFLLSLVGEWEKGRHRGVRITPALIGMPEVTLNLSNRNIDGRIRRYHLASDVNLLIFLDSSAEVGEGPTLESRVEEAILRPQNVVRSGNLYFGRKENMLKRLKIVDHLDPEWEMNAFLFDESSTYKLSSWTDFPTHANSRWVSGGIERITSLPNLTDMVLI